MLSKTWAAKNDFLSGNLAPILKIFCQNVKKHWVKFQVKGQEAEITGSTCNEHGIKVLTFSEPHGPVFHYEEPTNTTFGDQPHLRDPLDKKYIYLKNSTSSDTAGEGTFAAKAKTE